MSKTAEKVKLNVEGMTCVNCAAGITNYLEHKEGLSNINVSFATGEVFFNVSSKNFVADAISGINELGYKVVESNALKVAEGGLSFIEKKFLFTLPFTIPLLFAHMVFSPTHFLNHPFVQLALCLPVLITGLLHFGKSAYGSLKAGIPNMDVLIFIGSTAAFVYSLAGTYMYYGTHEAHNFLFFETAATIITLVLLGNVLEHRSVKQTTTAIGELSKAQEGKARRIEIHGDHEHIEEVLIKDILIGDLLIANMGDKIAVDAVVTEGSGSVDESLLTGESIPVDKEKGDKVFGGTILATGNLRMKAIAIGDDTVLSKIIEMVRDAQRAKPSIQKLGDRVSAVFVPVVLLIALGTFLITWLAFDKSVEISLMNSIAVLVISCPCAMGLATPTAVMVGIGRAAKQGILIKGGNTLEQLATIKKVVFDKTGTLTTGEFKLVDFKSLDGFDDVEARKILYSLESFSSHPIAKSITSQLKGTTGKIELTETTENKGIGISGKDAEGNVYVAGSYNVAKDLTRDSQHNIYVLKNGKLIAFADIEDEVRLNAAEAISILNKRGVETIMLSGDRHERCEKIANQLGIKKVYSQQLPEQKLALIEKLVKESPVAMVGDGINDAPALTRATVGISFSSATDVAMQSAQVILLHKGSFDMLTEAFLIGKHSLKTIKQNLFWAFFYNVLAIPFAAMGFLNPMIAAFSMAFSDVIVIGNSIRLKFKRLN